MKKSTTKLFACILALLLLALPLTACGTQKTETVFKPTGESKGTLKLGFDADYPPYGYLDTETNQYAGFDIEFAKAVCEKIGYTLELIPINWDFKDTELESGNINCIWSGFTIQGREDDYEWTCAYSDSSIVILVAADSGIADEAGLAGKVVSVQVDSSGEAALKEKAELCASFSGGAYKTCSDYTSAFTDLQSGAIDALVIDIGVAQKLIEGKTGYTILETPLAVEQYGVGFKKGDTELCKLINDAMVELADKASEIAKTYGLEDSIKISK